MTENDHRAPGSAGRQLRAGRAFTFRRDEIGLTSIEYAMIASVISIAIAAVVFLLGGQVQALYRQIVGALGG
ncbi:MAG: Flp family type IVb pilin [Rickettsiales bacterium]|jgi:Flp pilus assembly pilin Flp